MSEEQIQEALGQQIEEVIDQPIVEEIQDDIPELSSKEQTAWDQGWRPEDQFEGNPDNWKTAGEYVLFGEMQKQINDVKAESRHKDAATEERFANLNKLHEAQQNAAIADLKTKQRAAVEVADTDEFDRLQKQIDNQEPIQQTVPATPQQSAVLADWEARNPWVNDPNDEKGQDAIAFYNRAASRPGGTTEREALEYVDQQLAKLYPDHQKEEQQQVNARREMPTMTEQSRQRTNRSRSGKDATMESLTSQEADQWKQFGSIMWLDKNGKPDQQAFLRAITDARKV